jgi:AmmeMemoRadiSam system protein A
VSESRLLTPEIQERLLWVAARAIAAGCEGESRLAWTPNPEQYPAPLQELRATFVTIRRRGELRGCRGSVVATEPLVVNVARSARSAAFSDERFPPILADELRELEIHVSILSAPEPLLFCSESDLLARLRPGRDGLILSAGTRQGLFLPAVWKHLAKPQVFLEHLKHKAGLETGFWSSDIRVQRFTVDECRGGVAKLLGDEIQADNRPHPA